MKLENAVFCTVHNGAMFCSPPFRPNIYTIIKLANLKSVAGTSGSYLAYYQSQVPKKLG